MTSQISRIHLEFFVVLRVGLLSTRSIFFRCLFWPLLHCSFNESSHVLSENVTVVHRIVQRISVQSILQKWIEVVIEALCHQLDTSTFHSHHERCHSRVSHSVDIELVKRRQNCKIIKFSSSACKMQGRPSNIVFAIQIGLQLQDLF